MKNLHSKNEEYILEEVPFLLLFFFLRPSLLPQSSSWSKSSLLSKASAFTLAAEDTTSSTAPWDASRPQSNFTGGENKVINKWV